MKLLFHGITVSRRVASLFLNISLCRHSASSVRITPKTDLEPRLQAPALVLAAGSIYTTTDVASTRLNDFLRYRGLCLDLAASRSHFLHCPPLTGRSRLAQAAGTAGLATGSWSPCMSPCGGAPEVSAKEASPTRGSIHFIVNSMSTASYKE